MRFSYFSTSGKCVSQLAAKVMTGGVLAEDHRVGRDITRGNGLRNKVWTITLECEGERVFLAGRKCGALLGEIFGSLIMRKFLFLLH